MKKIFNSVFFTKSTKLTIAPVGDITPTGQSIEEFFADVIKREKEKGNPDVWLDNDFWYRFEKESGFVTTIEIAVYRFKQVITHKKILAEAERLGIKKIYSYIEGLAIIKALILAGEIDQNDKGITLYFTASQADSLQRFDVVRDRDGMLNLLVDEMGWGREWSAGDGTCFCNNEPQEN